MISMELHPELELLRLRIEQLRRATPGDLSAPAELVDSSMRGRSEG